MSTKPAESCMKQVNINDDAAGNAIGWNPDGVTTFFTIDPTPGITGSSSEFISVMVDAASGGVPSNCNAGWLDTQFESFVLTCDDLPIDGAHLFYQRVDIPTQLI